jgi:DNA-binding transcriptional MerR regulator
VAKSPDAFRTISEVADWLGVEAHVLRFWETRFAQVKPVKRAGGRRYYRPSDMVLLGGIRRLLHDEGMTIRGVQKVLREKGVGHVAAMSPELDLAAGEAAAPAPTRRATPAAPRPAPRMPAIEEDAPTLPFELPSDSDAAAVGDGRLAATDPDGVLPERLRARRAGVDPAAAADVLVRARALLERLRTPPE